MQASVLHWGEWLLVPKGPGEFLALRPESQRPAVMAHLTVTNSKSEAIPECEIDFETAGELFELLLFLKSTMGSDANDGTASAA